MAWERDPSVQEVYRVPGGLADTARHGVQAFYVATVLPDGTVVPGSGSGASATWDDLQRDVIQYDGIKPTWDVRARLDAFVAGHFLTPFATIDIWGLLVA